MAFSAHKNEEDIKEHFDDRAVVLQQVRAAQNFSLSLSLSLSHLWFLFLFFFLQPQFPLSILAFRLLSLLSG